MTTKPPGLTWLAGLGLACLAVASTSGAAHAADPSADPASAQVQQRTGSALPGSIVFIKNHNVWLANGNGSGQFQVTTDGTPSSPYRSPSQSDTGIIAAGKGHEIVRMTQNGTVLNSMNPPPLPGSAGTPLEGAPVDVAISPDGARIAYTFVMYQCPIGVSCEVRTASAVTDATQMTPYTQYGASFLAGPSWVGNGRTLESGGTGSQVNLKDLGGAPQLWFNDFDYAASPTDLGDAELSPDGHWVAAVRGYGTGSHLVWYSVSGNPFTGAPPAVPSLDCATSDVEGIADPTWAPDSNALAWQEPDGIWLKNDPAVCVSPQPQLLIPGGSEPDWSAAAVAPAARSFSVSGKPSLSGKAKVGKKLSAAAGSWSPAPTSVAYQWLRNGKPIKGATAASYKLKSKDRGKKVSVRVTGSRTGYPSQTVESAAKKVKGR